MVNRKRIEWIDVTKGAGILIVILGHCVYFGGIVHNVIFAFHMPLFFILSGIVYKEYLFKIQIIKRAKSLLLPYLAFCVVGLLITLIIPQWKKELSFKSILRDIYLGNPESINVSSVWFLIALFWVIIIYSLLSKLNNKMQWVIIIVLCIIGIIISKYPISVLPQSRLPLDLDVAIVALFFFMIGKHYTIIIKKCNYIIFIIMFLIFVLAVFLNGRVNLHELTFNNSILYIIESLTGSIVMIGVCKFLSERVSIINRLLKWLGKNTIIILGTQAIAIRIYVLMVNKISSSNYKLYELPLIHQVISFVFVTIVSITISFLLNNIKKGIKK